MKIKYTGMKLQLHRHGIPVALASVFGTMLIATPLAVNSALANGIVMGKVFWFHLSMALMATGTIGTVWPGRKKRWGRMQMIYNNKAYESVADDYNDLHDKLKHKPEFLFEEAQCLSKTGQYVEAIQVLERAKQLSGDPMIRYMTAKNRQAIGDYRVAERELLRAIEIVPERLYPYYLLAKLYAEPSFCRADKLKVAAQAVLTKEPKVESTAIREMREEIKKIIDDRQK